MATLQMLKHRLCDRVLSQAWSPFILLIVVYDCCWDWREHWLSTCPKSGGVGSIINPLIPGCPPSLCFQPILEPMGARGDKWARGPTHQQRSDQCKLWFLLLRLDRQTKQFAGCQNLLQNILSSLNDICNFDFKCVKDHQPLHHCLLILQMQWCVSSILH